MIASLIYLVLAILGLSVLIFIHELGHYFMARRVGMKVEAFSIGFGRPIFSWIHDGVQWQIGWLLFGGFVKIAGTEGDTDEQIYNTPGGFFNKSPWDRIKVAFMGPLANLVLGLLIFGFIWLGGGRQENFSEQTSVIGWVDPHSELYSMNVRPGDEVNAYNHYPYEGAKDHIYAPMTDPESVTVHGNHVNYETGVKEPFNATVKPYPRPNSPDKAILTSGILKSANYIIYNPSPDPTEKALMEVSPLKDSGIQPGDSLVWVDGERIFSLSQLNSLLNNNKELLTVERKGQRFLARVPRILSQEFKLESNFKEELVDWQHEAELNGTKLTQLYIIPYNLNNEGVVTGPLKFIDSDKENEIFPKHQYSPLDAPLQEGDKIIAVDGVPTSHSYQILSQVQDHRLILIVLRDSELTKLVPATAADADFLKLVNPSDLKALTQALGTDKPLEHSGNLVLLKPVTPITLGDWIGKMEKNSALNPEVSVPKLAADNKEAASQLMLGLPGIQDRKIQYNPNPFEMFWQTVEQIWRMLAALFTGSVGLRFMAGPVGIIQMVHDQWMLGFNEALYWLGVISVNLGILNLLPIPVLDGGTILFSFFELILGKRLHPKTLEKAIIPFAALLICFFVYITYYDITRIFGGFFQ